MKKKTDIVETFVGADPGIEKVSVETAKLKLLTNEKRGRGGKTYLLMVTVEGPLRGYLVDESLVAFDISAVQEVDTRTAIEIYSWESEVEAVLPDRETMKKNMVLSFWRAGAIDRDAARQPRVRRNLYDSAYPYKLEE